MDHLRSSRAGGAGIEHHVIDENLAMASHHRAGDKAEKHPRVGGS